MYMLRCLLLSPIASFTLLPPNPISLPSKMPSKILSYTSLIHHLHRDRNTTRRQGSFYTSSREEECKKSSQTSKATRRRTLHILTHTGSRVTQTGSFRVPQTRSTHHDHVHKFQRLMHLLTISQMLHFPSVVISVSVTSYSLVNTEVFLQAVYFPS